MSLMAEPKSVTPTSCIMFATADWDEPYWTNKQHCAKALSDLGLSVLYVESVGMRAPKLGSMRDWRRLKDRLLKGLWSFFMGAPERAPGIFVLSPLVIPAGHRHPLLRRLNSTLLNLSISNSRKKHAFDNPIVWTYHPYMLDVLSKESESKLLYHCVDDLGAVPGVDSAAFRSAEDILLHQATVVFATSPALVERCKAINANSHFLPNVVDAEHFGRAFEPSAPLPELACIPEPRLGYHGVLSDFKINFQLLIESARAKPEWQWVFVGEEREGQRSPLIEELACLPNVHFLGYQSYDKLPDYLRGIQVGLLPSLINDYTRSMFPMKYFEYIAAGVRVAATPLDALIAGKVSCVEFGSDALEFCAAIDRQLSKGRLSREQSGGLIGENTWKDRTRNMLRLLVAGI